jgi:hypothetical protein
MIINPYAFAGVATDPNFSTRKLLLHFDGANGDITTSDSSSAAHAITRRAAATLSNAQAVFGATSSTIATADAWSTPDHADFNIGNGQFTMECRVRFTVAPNAGSGIHGFMTQWGSGQQSFFFGWVLGQLAFYHSTNGSDNPNFGFTWAPTINTWYAVAVDRDASNVVRIYLNGSVVASATVSSTFFNSTSDVIIGGSTPFGNYTGFMDEFRYTLARAEYAGAYTPASSAFPNSA